MMEAPSRRPMTFTFLELLDRTFRLYRDNFVTIIGLVAIVTIPITIITLLSNPATSYLLGNQSSSFNRTTTASGAQFLSSILGLVQAVLIYAPLTYLASEYMFNRKVSIGEAFRGASSRFVKMGCGIIVLGIFVGAVAVFAGILVIAIPPALALFGILIYILVAAYSLFFPVLTLEDIGPSAAVTRSYMLGKRRFWTVVGLGIILGIISIIVSVVFGGSVTFLVLSSTPSNGSYATQLLLITFLSTLVGIFITPISPIAFTLLYYDIRTRTEGLDIMLDSSANPEARPADFAPQTSGFKIDGQDWRNIGILTLLGLAAGLLGSSTIQAFINQYTRSLR